MVVPAELIASVEKNGQLLALLVHEGYKAGLRRSSECQEGPERGHQQLQFQMRNRRTTGTLGWRRNARPTSNGWQVELGCVWQHQFSLADTERREEFNLWNRHARRRRVDTQSHTGSDRSGKVEGHPRRTILWLRHKYLPHPSLKEQLEDPEQHRSTFWSLPEWAIVYKAQLSIKPMTTSQHAAMATDMDVPGPFLNFQMRCQNTRQHLEQELRHPSS